MRTALLLILILTGATCLASGLLYAEEEGLEFARINVSTLVQPHRHQRGARLGAGAPHEEVPEVPDPQEPAPFVTADQLVELVHMNVDPRTWENLDGASLEQRGNWLLVRNRPDTLLRVREFLGELETEARRRVLLSIDVAEGSSAGFPAMDERALMSSSGSVVLPLGVERSLARTSRVQFVADYEVEIAQAANISVPVVMSVDEGLLAHFLATESLDGNHILLEGLVQTAAYGEPRRLSLGIDEEYMPGPYRTDARFNYGVLELPRYKHVQTHFTTVVPSSASSATVHLPISVRDRMVMLRMKATTRGQRGKTKLIDLGALVQRPMPVIFGKTPAGVHPLPRERLAPLLRFVPDELEPVYGGSEEIVDEVRSIVSPAYWEETGQIALLGSHRLHLRADGQRMAEVRTFLQKLERQAVRPVVVAIHIWSMSGAVESGPVKSFSRDGGELVAAGSLPTIMGRTASLMAGSTANFIAGYDTEVAQEARIADPIIGQEFDGLVLNLRPSASSSPRTVNLDLQMLLARRTFADRPFDTGTKFLGPIDHVRQDRSLVETNLEIPAGGTHVVDMGIDPEHPKRRLVAEISVELP